MGFVTIPLEVHTHTMISPTDSQSSSSSPLSMKYMRWLFLGSEAPLDRKATTVRCVMGGATRYSIFRCVIWLFECGTRLMRNLSKTHIGSNLCKKGYDKEKWLDNQLNGVQTCEATFKGGVRTTLERDEGGSFWCLGCGLGSPFPGTMQVQLRPSLIRFSIITSS